MTFLLLPACNSVPPTHSTADTRQSVRIANLPPTNKSVIRAVLASSDVPLTGHAFCNPRLPQQTLGEYMSQWFVELEDLPNPTDAQNSVRVRIDKMNLAHYMDFFSDKVAPADSDMNTEIGWYARVEVHQSAGEILWSYGVDFFINQDGLVESTSFRCIGMP
jgi:hypothetical protein